MSSEWVNFDYDRWFSGSFIHHARDIVVNDKTFGADQQSKISTSLILQSNAFIWVLHRNP